MKIPADSIIRVYELTYLLPVGTTDAELSQSRDAIVKLVTKHKGKILETQDWGKKTLAYKIRFQGKYHTEAVYTHLVIEFSPDSLPKFERVLQLEGKLMRQLLVVSETPVEEAATETEQKAE